MGETVFLGMGIFEIVLISIAIIAVGIVLVMQYNSYQDTPFFHMDKALG